MRSGVYQGQNVEHAECRRYKLDLAKLEQRILQNMSLDCVPYYSDVLATLPPPKRLEAIGCTFGS